MASEDSPHGQPQPADHAMNGQGLEGVLGTGGDKTATGREDRRNGNLVQADHGDKQATDWKPDPRLSTHLFLPYPKLFEVPVPPIYTQAL